MSLFFIYHGGHFWGRFNKMSLGLLPSLGGVLGDYTFLGIYPFCPDGPICWCTVVHGILPLDMLLVKLIDPILMSETGSWVCWF